MIADPEDGRAGRQLKRTANVFIGLAGGFIVGMTSVGSGSLMMVMLLLLYPRMSGKQLVGTDLVQAIPLVGAATLSHMLFGHVDFALTGSLLIGSLPGVYLGAKVSSRAPDAVIRPALVVILLASALKLLDSATARSGSRSLLVVLIGAPLWGATDASLRPMDEWESSRATAAPRGSPRRRWRRRSSSASRSRSCTPSSCVPNSESNERRPAFTDRIEPRFILTG